MVTYAKQSAQDIFIKIDITNRYSKAADITVIANTMVLQPVG